MTTTSGQQSVPGTGWADGGHRDGRRPVDAERPPRSAREELLGAPVDAVLPRDGDAHALRQVLAADVRRLGSAFASTSPARPLERWRALASVGRTDLVLGRLLEGHLDALAVLAEAGRTPVDGALYGVWASASGGTGLRRVDAPDGQLLTGGMRFCSGAGTLDRALVTARTADDELVLLDIAVDGPRTTPVPGTWPALGMDASDSMDVTVDHLPVSPDDQVGPDGFYLERAGLHLGGIGVAAVWLGGIQGLLDATTDLVRAYGVDDHQRAHVGAVVAALEGAAAALVSASRVLTAMPTDEQTGLPQLDRLDQLARVALTCRSVVEGAASVALHRLPRVAGAVAVSRDGAYAHRLADLTVYVRQHHGERDLARLGDVELDEPWDNRVLGA